MKPKHLILLISVSLAVITFVLGTYFFVNRAIKSEPSTRIKIENIVELGDYYVDIFAL